MLVSKRLIGRKISHEEVSKANRELTEAVEQWRNRDLSQEAVKYLCIDGVNFSMRSGRQIERVPVLVAIGVREDGTRLVLGLQTGDKESASSWREFFKDLKHRGLNGSKVTLGIMDGLPALEKVFQEEFTSAKTQRCQVHVARNVLAKVPRSQKQAVADDLRSIFPPQPLIFAGGGGMLRFGAMGLAKSSPASAEGSGLPPDYLRVKSVNST